MTKVMQALSLMKAHANNWVMESMKGAHIVELEADNATLLAKLEQALQALVKADTARDALSVNHGKLEEECVGLHAAVEALGQEKAEVVAAGEAELNTMRNKF
jgi:methylmalonyl-CoA mutase cobalamin-binding subunit